MSDTTASSKSLFSLENRERFGLHYLGMSLILAWYYCLWFSPDIFAAMPITDETVTFPWLATLSLTGIAFLIAPCALKNTRLYEHPAVMAAVACVTSAATLTFSMVPGALQAPVSAFVVFPVVFGVCNALIWVAWGEFHARRKSTFSLQKFAFVFGVVMLASTVVSALLPCYAIGVFVALLPLADAWIYRREGKDLGSVGLPTLLPKATRAKTAKATAIISIAVFIACMGCYFNIAIIPVDALFDNGFSYVVGIAASAVVCILIAFAHKVAKSSIAPYKILPWLVVACVAALALFAGNERPLYNLSFTITVTLAGIFEVFLVAYFGALSVKGHLSAVFAFGISSAVVRLGFFVGDCWAVVYEHNAFLAQHFTQATTLVLLCLLAAVLVPLMRQELVIVWLTQAPARTPEIEEVCDAAIEEFSLSKREGEILKYIARGYTIDSISKKLVISPYTTQTHVRHIYSKMHVHKRSELLDYINMHRNESV